MNWSQQQAAIYEWFRTADLRPGANLVVTARAGTGKTTTGVEAVTNHIPATTNGKKTSVLYCAFNKRIADELKARLKATSVDARTLHSLGFMYLRSVWGNLKLDADVENDRIQRAATIVDGHADTVQWPMRKALSRLIDWAKGGTDLTPPGILADIALAEGFVEDDMDPEWLGRVAFEACKLALEPDAQERITFADMLFVPVVKKMISPLYDWVIVDEAQDMNSGQLEAAKRACKPDGHIVIIGDDRQAIYGFRGADSNALDRMARQLDADARKLTTTYRCGTEIVAVAQKIVGDFAAPENAHAGAVHKSTVDDMLAHAQLGDAILSRVNAPLVGLCLALIRKGTRARIEGKDIGKQLLARAQKLRANSVPAFLAKVAAWANDAVNKAIATGKMIEPQCARIRDIEATLIALAEDCETIQQLYQRCETMFGDVAGRSDLVVLSTVHKAKGLEWRRVWLLQGTLYCFGKFPEDREEANIEYVAVTRAQEALHLVSGGC